METEKRVKCEITGSNDMEHLYTFKNFPVFMGCTNQDKKDDILHDMSWSISKSSGIIQLDELLPLDILYPEAHGAGIIGDLWLKHHLQFADFISNYSPKSVIEIGGGSGILSKEYQKNNDIEWTIVEPNPTPIDGVKAKFVKCFFDEKFKFNHEYDAILHSHVFEHIYHPNIFVKHIANFMKEGKRLIFSVPNMQVMLERKYTNCINFEHTIFLSEPYIEYLLSSNGFVLEKKEYFLDDHSIFYSFIKSEKSVSQITKLDKNLYNKNKELYLEYLCYHKKLVTKINKQMECSNKDIFLFGAHVFTQSLISFGLDVSKIKLILDNNPDKQGKRLYGTELFVASPKILKDKNNSLVILQAGVYNKEIKDDILNNINKNIEFLE
ncbi:MAG: class I SAM-dependent methyltransferase [Campylobacter concisus]|nr:class I SAM-dependent methyltransferase [Campylobacter concisus]